MPELPEVEHLRRTLEPRLLGAVVASAELRRRDILQCVRGDRSGDALLARGRIAAIDRRGKELALVCEDGRVLCIHLGMSGQLVLEAPDAAALPATHRHAEWRLEDRCERLIFRDPRRFGGLVALPDRDRLEARWAPRGPDALSAPHAVVRRALAACAHRRAPIKTLLLDQSVVAGVGNIYADEALFRTGLRPDRPASSLTAEEWNALARALRRLLRTAVARGGSSLRDYRDGTGRAGAFQWLHRVYGRGGLPCPTCRAPLVEARIGGRTTTWCTTCQG